MFTKLCKMRHDATDLPIALRRAQCNRPWTTTGDASCLVSPTVGMCIIWPAYFEQKWRSEKKAHTNKQTKTEQIRRRRYRTQRFEQSAAQDETEQRIQTMLPQNLSQYRKQNKSAQMEESELRRNILFLLLFVCIAFSAVCVLCAWIGRSNFALI